MSSNPDDSAASEEAGDTGESDDPAATLPVSRRTLLAGTAVAGAGAVGAVALGRGGDRTQGGTDGSTAERTPRQTTPVPEAEARRLAEQFAPTLYFGRREQWFPTDPRPYTSEREGETVVDGFDALDGYTAAKGTETRAPDPTVFYHVLEYTDRLAVVQYWLYSAFDQFSVNFHWHDWELLQAFVDRDTGEPVLYVASAHSRKVPNNEYLDPGRTPAIISEVGSHSSALGMNASRDTFQRVSIDGLVPDVTNGVLAIASGEEGLPLAYGLPRDEGVRLPYVVPELDSAPLTDHPDLPSVSSEDLVAGDLSVGSFTDLARPPTDLPRRELGSVFEPETRADASADEHYTLVPTEAVEDITAFTGPQLSFEFYVPGFVEDIVSSHITTTSPPWEQRRYLDPLADVTDRAHREVISERYDVDQMNRGEMVVGRLKELQPTGDVDVGVTLAAPPVEAVARLASDPVAVPTFGGVAAFVDVEPGSHTLTVNGPGYAPYAQRVQVGSESAETPTTSTATETLTTSTATETPTDDVVRVGIGGRVGLVPTEDAVKLEIDAADRGGTRRVRVDDDAAGRVFDAPPVETDGRAGVYVHRAGGYTVEVTDTRGETSVERVNPGPNQNAAEVAKARTGVSGVTQFLVDFLTEARETVQRLLQQGGREQSSESDTDPTDRVSGDVPTDEASTGEVTTVTTEERVESSQDVEAGDLVTQSDEDDSDETPTPTPTPRPEPTDEPTATPTPTPTSDSKSTPASTPEPTDQRGSQTAREELQQLLDEAVSRARAANEAARSGDAVATEDALGALREVLARLSSFTTRDGAPQPASRVAARRAETADERVEKALEAL